MVRKQRVLFDDSASIDHSLPHSSSNLTPPLTDNTIQDIYQQGVQAGIQQKVEEVNQKIEAKKEGEVEQIKEDRKEIVKMNDILRNIAQKDNIILLKAKTIFPFDFFPDTIIIDTMKVSVINKTFFASQQVATISIKDVIDVTLETAFFLSNIVISYMPKVDSPTGMIQPHEHRVNLLNNKDAMRIKNLLKGIQLAQREGIDVAKMRPEDLTEFIEKVGTIKTDF